MLVTDAQVHVWAASTPERPWPPFAEAPYKPHGPAFSKDELLREMDAAGVNRAVLVPPGWEGYRNDLALAAARQHPNRFAVMGRFDVYAAGAREQMAVWRQQQGMLGIRFTFFKSNENLAEHWVWRAAQEAAVPIMLVANGQNLRIARQIAERCPQLKLAIDHMAIPKGKKDDEAFAHMDDLIALAKYPNVAVKATSLPGHTTDTYPYRRLHPHLRRVYDAFGPRRLFWGSDMTKLPCTYRQALTMFSEEIPWLTGEDKEWILGRGVSEWIGWKAPTA